MTWWFVSLCVSFKIVIIREIVLLVLETDSQQMYFPPTPFPKSRALGTAQVNKLLQCYLQTSCLLSLNHCIILDLYCCKDIVMEHKHNHITGEAFIELLFVVVCTGCKQCSLLSRPMSMFSLLSLQLIPVLSPPTPPRFSLHFVEAGPSILKLPCGTAPGKLGSRLHWHLALSCSAALCLCESLQSIGSHFSTGLFSCPLGFSDFPELFIDTKLWRL